jgi:hypothetical protein
MSSLRDEAGAGALWLMLLLMAVLPAIMGTSLLLHLFAVRQSIVIGSELAALSGACAKAEVIARRNGVELVDCESTDGEVRVTVRGVALTGFDIYARARAAHTQ